MNRGCCRDHSALPLGAAAEPLDMDCRLYQDAELGSATSRRWGDDVGYEGKEVRVHFAIIRKVSVTTVERLMIRVGGEKTLLFLDSAFKQGHSCMSATSRRLPLDLPTATSPSPDLLSIVNIQKIALLELPRPKCILSLRLSFHSLSLCLRPL